MTVAVIGADGQLGSDVCDILGRSGFVVLGLNHEKIEIRDIDSLSIHLREIRPNFVVNTAGMHDAESFENDPIQAYRVNALVARNLAIICILN